MERDILEHNHLHGIRFLKEAAKRNINLSPNQAKSILNELPEPIADIVEFAIYYGLSEGKYLKLKINQLRLHDLIPTGEVDFVAKGGRCKTFSLGKPSVELLNKVIGSRETGYMFLNPRTKTRWVSIHKPFDRAVKKLCLKTREGKKLRFHNLRHVFGNWLSEAGVSLDDIR